MTGLSMGRVTDGIVAAGSGCALVAVVASLDTRVKELFASMLAGDPVRHVSAATRHVQQFTQTAMETIGYQGTEDAHLLLLAVAGGALVLLMLKL
jgi:hypothetical protein